MTDSLAQDPVFKFPTLAELSDRFWATATDEDRQELKLKWIEMGLGEVSRWIDHVEARIVATQAVEDEIHTFDHIARAEITFGLGVVLNLLAQIDLRKHSNLNIKEEIVPWLGSALGMPEEVATALWFCLRNPTVHMGRADMLVDYGQTHEGVVITGGLDFQLVVKYEAVPNAKGDVDPRGAWKRMEWLFGLLSSEGEREPDARDRLAVHFSASGLVTSLRAAVAASVISINAATDLELKQLGKLNRRLPFLPELATSFDENGMPLAPSGPH